MTQGGSKPDNAEGWRTPNEPPARNLADFTRQIWPLISDEPFIDCGWYLQHLCRHFGDVLDGRGPRLLISAPSRALKTTIAQLVFPAWAQLMRPDASFLMVSPTSRLAEFYHRQREALAASPEFMGYRQWCGIVDQPTGRRDFTAAFGAVPSQRYDVIIGDDILFHPRFGMQAWAWWDEHLSMRLRPRQGGGGAVLIHSRSAFDDMVVCSVNRGGYYDVRFPMEWHPSFRAQCPDDPRRAAGELLCPGLWAAGELAEVKVKIGPDQWKWRFQQGLEPPKQARKPDEADSLSLPIPATAIMPFLAAGAEPPDDLGEPVGFPPPGPAIGSTRFFNWRLDVGSGELAITAVAIDGGEERDVTLTYTDAAGGAHPIVLDADDTEELSEGLSRASQHSRGWRFCDGCDVCVSSDELKSPGIAGNEPDDLWCRACRDVEVCAVCNTEVSADDCDLREDIGPVCDSCLEQEAREIAACHHDWVSDVFDDEDGEFFRMCTKCSVCMPLEVGDDANPLICDGWVAVPEA